MKLIILILIVGFVEVWTYLYLYDVLGFSSWVALYITTTLLGAVVLFIRYSAFRAAINAAKYLHSKWKKKQKNSDYVPSAQDVDKQKLMVFLYIYLLSLVLIAMPGIVTDVIGMLLLIPLISIRCTAKLSKLNFYQLMQLTDLIDEHPYAHVSVNNFLWIRLSLIFVICTSSIWIWGFKGAVAAIFFSIAIVISINQIWRFYCSFTIHPDGLHGYNKSQELLRQYNSKGALYHKVMRGFWMQKWANFLYDWETNRWSWRPYVFFCVLAAIFYWNPFLGGAIAAAFISMILKVAIDITVPTVLYLGSSDPKSHEVLRMLRINSGIEWVSLLDDSAVAYIPSESQLNETDPFIAATVMAKTNKWSIRMNETEDWMAVVNDFIRTSAVIFVRPENEGAVREELEALENAKYLQRIIIILTETFDPKRLPERLIKCVLQEDEAFALIEMIRIRPGKFRTHIRNRFNEAAYESNESHQVSN